MEGWDYRWLQRQVCQYFSLSGNIECHDMEFERLHRFGLERTVVCVPAYIKIPAVHWFFV